jgi:hypothetical protein
MRRAALLLLLSMTACMPANPAYEARVSALASEEVSPGLASCLLSIDRPDVARDPGAAMSQTEIEALVTCTARRASR